MIKKYNQFIVESKEIPGPNNERSKMVVLSDSEVELFASEPVLETLISDNKVSLLAPELWYLSDDTETINILSNFFKMSENQESIKESHSVNKEGDIESISLTCPYCMEETSSEFLEEDMGVIECDNCLEEFEASRITYYVSRKIN